MDVAVVGFPAGRVAHEELTHVAGTSSSSRPGFGYWESPDTGGEVVPTTIPRRGSQREIVVGNEVTFRDRGSTASVPRATGSLSTVEGCGKTACHGFELRILQGA